MKRNILTLLLCLTQSAVLIAQNAVDIFYLTSTEVLAARDEKGQVTYRAQLTAEDSMAMKAEMDYVEKHIAQGDMKMYAPYYHQFTFEAIGLPRQAYDSVFAEVTQEVQGLFDAYIAHENKGRPFCLMGFSQGAMLVVELLKTMKPEVYDRMVAAYVMGYRLGKEDVKYPYVRPARGADDRGVTVSFNSCLSNEAAWPLVAEGAVAAINPVSWSTDGTPATFVFENKTHTATLDTRTNLLIIDTDSTTKAGYRAWMHNPVYEGAHVNEDCLHHWDLLFYTEMIHDNILKRQQSTVNSQQLRKQYVPAQWGAWTTWGNQGDGWYRNPVIPADYSDIDCIEHEGWYYAISSTFQFEPGMVILRSRNMVDWEICSHAVPDVSQISKAMTWQEMDRYARGIWAGAIRWHKGRFYVYFGCPNEGMFVTTAKRIEGPWTPLHKMNIGGGWDDPCPLFDDNGKNYFVASHFADNYKTYIFEMDEEGKEVDWNTAVLVNEGAGREANKLYKWNGRYYHLYSEAPHGGRYLMMQRADNALGPYTEKHQLTRHEWDWYEPNQGGYVQDKDGRWFFLTHHGRGDWGGREASLLPVTWVNGWPIIGHPDQEGIGTMVWEERVERREANARQQSMTEGFAVKDWEWNYHPRKGYYKKSGKKVVLKAFRPLEKDNLMKAGNTLTMRSYQTEGNEVRVRLDCSKMENGQRSGLCHFASTWSEYGVMMEEGIKSLYYRDNTGRMKILATHLPDYVYLHSTWGLDGLSHYAVSTDGETMLCGATYRLQWGNYRGDRVGLYTYNNRKDGGEAVFDRFAYKHR